MLVDMLKRKARNYFQDNYALNAQNWDSALKVYPILIKGFKYFDAPVLGNLLKKIGRMEDRSRHFSQAYVVPINRDLNYEKKDKKVVLPYTMVKKLIETSTHRVIMNKCYCRDGNNCTNYPPEFGCIMLGEGTKVLVKNGIARDVTVKEAVDHLKKAADMGLVAAPLWMEVEGLLAGIGEKQHKKFLELCLCCPCCCLGLRGFKDMGPVIGERVNSIGWKPVSEDRCVGCGVCADVCPMEAVSVGAESISISDKCIGCGICAANCPQEVIKMQQVGPIKKNIIDYFWGFTPEI
jgi:Pyruvate/2-oxoacid:ferredoxin oxidoreductase delta subunit